jgi:quercetin dioxygenase-like cupin family protein
VRLEGFRPAENLRAEEGWVDMNVKFLITSDTVGAQSTVFGITVFPPEAKHDIHRHPHAEETEYLVEGEGIARVGDNDVLLRAGEIVFVPENAYHGFENTSATARAVMVWCYGGAASLQAAGYVTEDADRERSG